MLAANVCASDFLRKRKQPMLYRIHEGPTPEKLAALREFLKGFGLSLSGGDTPHAKDYAKLLARVKDRPDAQLLQTVMLRSLQQAVYSPDNVGPFRARLRVLHAFHFADPPLSGPARASRDQGGAEAQALPAGRLARARRALLDDRAPRRRSDARRRQLAQVLLHARQGGRDVHGQRSAA